MYKYRFTVFTATFNRAHTLYCVYESLRSQTLRDFEWLIIDDGSTDNTRELVEQWQKDADFPIRYFYQENQGKHIAFNRAVSLAQGELFVPVDSDDSFVPNTLERFWYHWNNIPPSIRDNFSGVTCLCQDENGNIIGDRFPKDVMDSDELEMLHKYKVRGEKWGFHRTVVLQKVPFPEIPKGPYMQYMPDAIVWDAIALKYKKRFINEALRIYHRSPDSVDRHQRAYPQRYALGRRLCHKQKLNRCSHLLKYDPLGFSKSAVNYVRFSLHMKMPLKKQWQELTNWIAKMLYIIALPAGWAIYRLDKRKAEQR